MVASVLACLVLVVCGILGLNRLSALIIVASKHDSYRDAGFFVGEIVEPRSRRSLPTYTFADIEGQDYRYTLGWEKGQRHWNGNRDWEGYRNLGLKVSVLQHPVSEIHFGHSVDIIPREVHEHLTAHLLLALLKMVAPIAVGIFFLRLILRNEQRRGTSRA